MSRKKGLLSIGDMSKLTGANIKSLRYYERLDILKPVFVDPDSSYRYYSFDQIYLIELIMVCIEFDMPLKDLKQYIDDNETMDYQNFLKKCREIAEQKLKSVQRGLKLIDEIESKINLTESNKVGEIYSREFSEKYFYVKPCKMPLGYVDWIEIFNSLFETPHLHKEDSDLIFEYGLLYECTPEGSGYYAFFEIPKNRAEETGIKIIPVGIYLCRQSEDTEIERAYEIFDKQLTGSNYFLAIESEIFTGKHKINNPLKELRVISL